MKSFTFLVIAWGFAFSCAFNDVQSAEPLEKGETKPWPQLTSSLKKRTETKCEKLRAEAQAKVEEGDILVLVPECRADGSFNPVQCDQRFSVNFANCWCVDENGDKIPGTEVTVGSVQGKLPECGEHGDTV
ncbi:hypothetical protein ACROYT_G023656 [Oculina patagonica]